MAQLAGRAAPVPDELKEPRFTPAGCLTECFVSSRRNLPALAGFTWKRDDDEAASVPGVVPLIPMLEGELLPAVPIVPVGGVAGVVGDVGLGVVGEDGVAGDVGVGEAGLVGDAGVALLGGVAAGTLDGGVAGVGVAPGVAAGSNVP